MIVEMKRIIACALIFFISCSVWSCQKKVSSATISNMNQQETPVLLEEPAVFRGTKAILPEGMNLCPAAEPYADEDRIFCLASEMIETASEDGTVVRGEGYSIVTLSADGKTRDAAPLNLPESAAVIGGKISGDGLMLLTLSDGIVSVFMRDASGDRISTDLTPLLAGIDQQFIALDADEHGNIWAAASHEILALDKDFTKRFSILVDGYVRDIAATEDGGAWVLQMDADMTAQRVEPTGLLTNRILLDNSAGSLVSCGDVLYCDSTKGISAVSTDGLSEIVNYAASNLSAATSRLLTVLDEDRVLLAKNGTEGTDLYLYRRSAGEEPMEAITLEAVVALPEGTDSGESQFWRMQMAEFNSSHRDIQIHLTDYAETWGTESADALARDLLTGTIKPDILLGNPGTEYVGTVVERTIVEHGMFRDLTPYLNADPEVNFDTVLAAAIRTCTADETVWGIPTAFRTVTLVAPDSLLGPFAGSSGWTVTDLLDCIDALPDGVTPSLGINQRSALDVLLGSNGLAAFMNRETGTCSFDGPDFLRLLRFISTLPKDHEDALKTSPAYTTYWDATMSGDNSGMIEPYHTGKVFLRMIQIAHLSDYTGLEMQFGTKDVTVIGYPTATPEIPGSGIEVIPELPMIILNTCEHPDEAWTLLKAILSGDQQHLNPCIPSLKASYEVKERNSIGSQIHYFYNGFTYAGSNLPSQYAKQPHITVSIKKEDLDAFRILLDNAGAPYIGAVPLEIREIVEEEISAMTAGVSMAEQCASKIQSRVSIWLAEHK